MTRLIDADKLPNIYTATHQEMIMSFEEAPTVDAIPVEWIEQYGKANWYDFGTQYNAITKMLEEWERLKKEE